MAKLSILTSLNERQTREAKLGGVDVTQYSPEVVSALDRAKRKIAQAIAVQDSLAKEIENLVEKRDQHLYEAEQSTRAMYSVKKKTIEEVKFHTSVLQMLREKEGDIERVQNDYLEYIDQQVLSKRKGIVKLANSKEASLKRKIDYLETKGEKLAEIYALIVKIHENLLRQTSQNDLERLNLSEGLSTLAETEKELLNKSHKLSESLEKAGYNESETKRLLVDAQKTHNKLVTERAEANKLITEKTRKLDNREKVLSSLKAEIDRKDKEQKEESRRLLDWSRTLQATAREIEERKKRG